MIWLILTARKPGTCGITPSLGRKKNEFDKMLAGLWQSCVFFKHTGWHISKQKLRGYPVVGSNARNSGEKAQPAM